MASLAARAERNHLARQRLETALAALSDRLGVALPADPKRMRDADLQPIVEIERFANFAEAVLAALPEPTPAAKKAKAA